MADHGSSKGGGFFGIFRQGGHKKPEGLSATAPAAVAYKPPPNPDERLPPIAPATSEALQSAMAYVG